MWTDHIGLQGVSIIDICTPKNPNLLSEYNWEAQAHPKNIAFSLQKPAWVISMPRVGSYETFLEVSTPQNSRCQMQIH